MTLVAIGASAGGPAALATVLRGLPKGFTGALVLVQHLDEQMAPTFADYLRQHSPLPIQIAAEGDRVQPGVALLAGTNDHLVLKTHDRLGYTCEPADYVYRPSVDAFFDSVTRRWRGEAIGVLLTGMGRDGAAGLKQLRGQGRHTIAQDQQTSAVYGMPKAAAAIDAAVDVLPLEHIARRIVELVGALR
jgi:chemotaxis response regulator CheB